MLKDGRGFSTIVVILITAFLSLTVAGGGVWYWQNQEAQKQKTDSDKKTQELQKQVEDLKKEIEEAKSSDKDSETVNWKTFSSTSYGYSIKYPSGWVYKDYGKLPEGAKMVAFADTTSSLPREQSDQPAIIGISISDKAIVASELSQCSSNVKKTTVTIGSGISATKWTTLGNCADDMFGDSKIITVEVKQSNGKYVHIENFNNQEKSIFEKMLTTFKLI